MSVIPGHAHFPAQTQIERQVGFDFPGILGKRATVTCAGIEELQSRLGVRTIRTDSGGSAEEEIGDIAAGHRAVKDELAIRAGKVAFVHLQVAVFAAELPSVPAERFRKHVA